MAVEGTTLEIESLCAKIASRLLKKHKYAKRVEVSMKSDYMIMKTSPVTHLKTQEMTNIMADAIGIRNEEGIVIRKMIGAEVVGMTVCPCAQESTKESAKLDLLKFLDEETTQKVLDTVSFSSHNQRGRGMIMMEVPENQMIRAEDLISIIEDSMSSPVCELLKRSDENAVVYMPIKIRCLLRTVLEIWFRRLFRNILTYPTMHWSLLDKLMRKVSIATMHLQKKLRRWVN